MVLGTTLGGAPAVGAVDPALDESVATDRAWAASLVSGGTPSVSRAAQAALLGSDAEIEAFAESGFDEALKADYRASAQVLAGTGGAALKAAANEALAGSDEQLRAFVDCGFRPAWAADEQRRVVALLDTSEHGTSSWTRWPVSPTRRVSPVR